MADSLHAGIKYVTGDEGGLESHDAFSVGRAKDGATLAIIYEVGAGGVLRRRDDVPHGSAEQGHTWFRA